MSGIKTVLLSSTRIPWVFVRIVLLGTCPSCGHVNPKAAIPPPFVARYTINTLVGDGSKLRELRMTCWSFFGNSSSRAYKATFDPCSSHAFSSSQRPLGERPLWPPGVPPRRRSQIEKGPNHQCGCNVESTSK